MGNSNNSHSNSVTTEQTDKVQSGWERIKQTRKYNKLKPKQKKMAKRLFITLLSLGVTLALTIAIVIFWINYHKKNRIAAEQSALLDSDRSYEAYKREQDSREKRRENVGFATTPQAKGKSWVQGQ